MTVQPTSPGVGQVLNPLEAQLLQQAGLQGIYGQYAPTDTLIYLGPGYGTPGTPGRPKRAATPGTDMFTVDQAKAKFIDLPGEDKERFLNSIKGVTGKRPDDFFTQQYYWDKMVDAAGAYSSQTGKNISVFDYADKIAAQSTPGSGGGGPTSTYSKSTQINLSDPSTARSLLDQTLGSYLGRNPTQKEYSNFLAVLNGQEQASPTVTEARTRSASSGSSASTVSTSKTTGGIDRAQVAKEYVESRPDYAETQLSTTGLSALLELFK